VPSDPATRITYVAIEITLIVPRRWEGVPFLLATGKALIEDTPNRYFIEARPIAIDSDVPHRS